MKSEKLEVNTGAEMFPAILCAKTRISTNSNLSWPPKLSRRLTGEGLTVRGAHSRTGLRRATSPASATPTSAASPSIVSYRPSSGSGRGWK